MCVCACVCVIHIQLLPCRHCCTVHITVFQTGEQSLAEQGDGPRNGTSLLGLEIWSCFLTRHFRLSYTRNDTGTRLIHLDPPHVCPRLTVSTCSTQQFSIPSVLPLSLPLPTRRGRSTDRGLTGVNSDSNSVSFYSGKMALNHTNWPIHLK